MAIKRYLIYPLLFLAIINILILLNVPGLRQIASFIGLTLFPGWLLLQILHLNKLGLLKTVVLATGLSIFYSMFGGLLLNMLYPLLQAPLSLGPLLIAYDISILVLFLIAYWRNRHDYAMNVPRWRDMGISSNTLYFLLIPVLLPLLAILGTQLMNTRQDNIILMIMIGLIPLYILFLAVRRKYIPESYYPVAIWMIALALILMRGLTSRHILGTDIFGEYYFFQAAANNSHWDMTGITHIYDTCLSVTILPAIYLNFLNVNPEYIMKIVPGLIVSAVPLVMYLIARTYLGAFRGMLCALLMIFQLSFLTSMLDATRSGIALLFIGLVVLLISEENISGMAKAALLIIFGTSAVVSHYSTGYTFVIWMIILAGLLLILNRLLNRPSDNIRDGVSGTVTLGISALFFAILFFWYSQVTAVPFRQGVDFVTKTFQNLIYLGSFEMRQESVSKMFGIGIESVPSFINTISHDIIFILIAVGIIAMLRKFKYYEESGYQREYLLSAFIFIGLDIALIVVPYISKQYATGRPFVTSLFLLAPAFVIGGEIALKFVRRVKWADMLLCLLLILQYSCILYVPYHLFKMPLSPYYETSGPGRDQFYIYDSEISGAKWLYSSGEPPSVIYGDWRAWTRLSLAAGSDMDLFQVGFIDEDIWDNDFKTIGRFTKKKMETGDYIYLRHANVANNLIYLDAQKTHNMEAYEHVFYDSNKIYTNDSSAVYKLK